MQFPVNFQMAPKNINQGFFGAVEAYVNRPDADPEKIKKISNVLDEYGLRISTNKGTIGAKMIPAGEVIDRNLKTLGLSTDIGKETITAGKKKLKAFDELSSRVGSGVDPDLAARAVKEQFVDPLTSRVPTGKGIRALSTLGKIALPEAYFAPFSAVYDIYQGRTPKEILLNIATLGAGAPALDTFKKAQALKKKGLLDDYKKAIAKANRADQALAEEVETLGMDTPAEEFAEPEFTVGEQIAAITGMEEDKKLSERLEQKAAEYQRTYENELKKGLLEVTPDDEPLPEEMGVKPELPFQEEEEESLGFFDRATGNVPRGFMSKGGIMAIRNKDKSDETN